MFDRFQFEASVPMGQRVGTLMPLTLRAIGLEIDGIGLLHNIDLSLGASGCTMIMGPNGAGKSLLLRVIHGLIAPSQGMVDWNGTPAAQATRRQALVFQKPVLLRRSVRANLDFVLKARGLPLGDADALLGRVGLAHKAGQPARLLSGGEQQRLALARALATRPEALLLDEPTASLDPASTRAIEAVVAGAVAEGLRVIFVTHDVGQARRLADDVVFLNAGRVAEHQPAARFFNHPQSDAARAYLTGRIPMQQGERSLL